MSKILLEIKNLSTNFHTSDGVVPAVDGVSLTVTQGETLAIVGESGSGKSVTALSVLRLIPIPPGEIIAEAILFNGKNLLTMTEDNMLSIRGNDISMIFQEPMTSLNPVLPVGFQVSEALMVHQNMRRKEAREHTIELFRLVGIPSPEKRVDEYPHQLSGGMRQRVMIAMALSCKPRLLIADEPTTALDVTIQAQILELLSKLKEELGMSLIIITHNLGVVAEMAERVIVMYAGQVVEEASVMDTFKRPYHPYTYGLLRSIPSIEGKKVDLATIPGVVPSPMFYPKGCRFSPRCAWSQDKCRDLPPDLVRVDRGRKVRCWYPLLSEEDRLALERLLIDPTEELRG